MRIRNGTLGAAIIALASVLPIACAPLRLGDAPQIRGTVVTVAGSTLGIRHKTGKIYRVEVTPDTSIVNSSRPDDRRLCSGQRATVFLVSPRQFTASSIMLWSGRCS